MLNEYLLLKLLSIQRNQTVFTIKPIEHSSNTLSSKANFSSSSLARAVSLDPLTERNSR
jgi:hypothetical protein